MDVAEKIYEIVKSVPRGRVVAYGWVAKKAKTSPRVVGRLLHNNPDPKNIPCHRVVNAKGKIAENYVFGGAPAQKRKLLAEGAKFEDSMHVDLASSKYIV